MTDKILDKTELKKQIYSNKPLPPLIFRVPEMLASRIRFPLTRIAGLGVVYVLSPPVSVFAPKALKVIFALVLLP